MAEIRREYNFRSEKSFLRVILASINANSEHKHRKAKRIVPTQKDEFYDVISLKIEKKVFLKFCIVNSLVPLIICTKFQMN